MRFADLPIRQKLLTMALVITAIVLLASVAVLVTYDLISLRRDLTREVGTLSEVIALNSTAAIAFNAREDAAETLKTLAAERSFVSAALYDNEGRLFAFYGPGASPEAQTLTYPGKPHEFRNGRLYTYRRVQEGGQTVGLVVVCTNLSRWYERLWVYVAVCMCVVGLAFLASVVFSAFLRRSITRPIDELARIAGLVSAQGNISVRARRFGADEMGALTDTFNHMLERIQQREAELRDSETQRMIALQAAGLGTWRYDPKRDVLDGDSTFRQLLGVDGNGSRTLGTEMLQRVHPEDRERVSSEVDKLLANGGGIELEFRVIRPDGSIRWLRDSGRVLFGSDGVSPYLTGTLMDITDRKTSEQQILQLNIDLEKRVAQRTSELEDSNRNLEAFAYSVSHDLRAPLRIISGYADVLLEDRGKDLPEDHQMCLTRIVEGARKMNRLIDDLLHFSRLGKQPLRLQSTSLDRLVDDALAELERETRNRTIEWRRAPLPEVQCDPGLMRQVFSNLLSNALKYSRPRNPAVIQVDFQDKPDERVLFVRDNGVGFDSAASSRLFGVFQRLHSAQEFEGNGVGLATAARIIRRHGGRIWAESHPDQGATFYFSLPKSRATVETRPPMLTTV